MFLVYLYVYHRDLHSFPTRRSSDLHLRLDRHRLQGLDAGEALDQERLVDGAALELLLHPRLQRRRDPDRDSGVDRKSTRLNSSHTVISYAVFCLKKKKNPQDDSYRF